MPDENIKVPGHRRRRTDYHHASRILRSVATAVGVKPIRFHDLRHSFASNFVMRGGSIYKLQRLLGRRFK